jgi:hypothetical protein
VFGFDPEDVLFCHPTRLQPEQVSPTVCFCTENCAGSTIQLMDGDVLITCILNLFVMP